MILALNQLKFSFSQKIIGKHQHQVGNLIRTQSSFQNFPFFECKRNTNSNRKGKKLFRLLINIYSIYCFVFILKFIDFNFHLESDFFFKKLGFQNYSNILRIVDSYQGDKLSTSSVLENNILCNNLFKRDNNDINCQRYNEFRSKSSTLQVIKKKGILDKKYNISMNLSKNGQFNKEEIKSNTNGIRDEKNDQIAKLYMEHCNSVEESSFTSTPSLAPTPAPSHFLSSSFSNIQTDPNFLTEKYKDKSIYQSKRHDYISWDDYFMGVAFLSAMRSKDPGTQVGACIVNQDNRIVGIGYNGFPQNCDDDALPWDRTPPSTRQEKNDIENENAVDAELNILDTKYPYVCHAEMNAILNRNTGDTRGARIYVALFPCNDCAKLIIQSGIKEVIYMSNKYAHKAPFIASERLLKMAKVAIRQHRPKEDKIVIDFGSAEEN